MSVLMGLLAAAVIVALDWMAGRTFGPVRGVTLSELAGRFSLYFLSISTGYLILSLTESK